MTNLSYKNLKLAVQKNGRLTNDTLEFLRRSGLEFESYQQRLFSICRNFPLEILYVRNNDIPDYVSSGVVDLGVLGQNMINEEKPKVKKLLNLKYGYCSLVVAVPNESSITKCSGLDGKTIATTYPKSTKNFFKKQGINVRIARINGSVEIAPALGIAQAIVDLTSTGRTLAENGLRILSKVYDSESVLVVNKQSLLNGRKVLLEKLMERFKKAIK